MYELIFSPQYIKHKGSKLDLHVNNLLPHWRNPRIEKNSGDTRVPLSYKIKVNMFFAR